MKIKIAYLINLIKFRNFWEKGIFEFYEKYEKYEFLLPSIFDSYKNIIKILLNLVIKKIRIRDFRKKQNFRIFRKNTKTIFFQKKF